MVEIKLTTDIFQLFFSCFYNKKHINVYTMPEQSLICKSPILVGTTDNIYKGNEMTKTDERSDVIFKSISMSKFYFWLPECL